MIEVTVKLGRGELAHIKIINTTRTHGTHADYSIEFAVHTVSGVALYQRSVYAFPRKEFNALALLRIALETLTEEELSLDADPDATGSPNLARRLNRPM